MVRRNWHVPSDIGNEVDNSAREEARLQTKPLQRHGNNCCGWQRSSKLTLSARLIVLDSAGMMGADGSEKSVRGLQHGEGQEGEASGTRAAIALPVHRFTGSTNGGGGGRQRPLRHSRQRHRRCGCVCGRRRRTFDGSVAAVVSASRGSDRFGGMGCGVMSRDRRWSGGQRRLDHAARHNAAESLGRAAVFYYAVYAVVKRLLHSQKSKRQT